MAEEVWDMPSGNCNCQELSMRQGCCCWLLTN